jgi:hypothetical protein
MPLGEKDVWLSWKTDDRQPKVINRGNIFMFEPIIYRSYATWHDSPERWKNTAHV